jgi:hypothetical protein
MDDITAFLTHLAQAYPQVFFKPVFALAAASSEVGVSNKLEVLYSISRSEETLSCLFFAVSTSRSFIRYLSSLSLLVSS